MRVLVTGGRDYADRARVFEVLDELHARHHITVIIHGACGDDWSNVGERSSESFKGADRWADEWASSRSVQVARYPAKWRLLGRAAGRERNRRMLMESRAQLVVAFPGGTGTAHMTKIAFRALGSLFVVIASGISKTAG